MEQGESGPAARKAPEPKPETFAQRLRRLRREQGKSQRQLAGPGVTYAYISRLEAGSRTPSIQTIRRLAAKLNVSPEYLETGVELTSAEQRELWLAETVLELRLAERPDAATRGLRELLREAVTSADSDLAFRVRLALAEALLRAGEDREAGELLAEAIGSPLLSASGFPEAYLAYARSLRSAGQLDDAGRVLEHALASLDHPGPDNPSARVRLGSALAEIRREQGESARARVLARDIAARTRAPAEPLRGVRERYALARRARERGKHRVALGELRRAVALASELDARAETVRARLTLAEQLLWDGEIESAADHLEAAAHDLRLAVGDVELGGLCARSALLAARRGDLPTARTRAAEATARLPADAPDVALVRLALAYVDTELGQHEHAAASFGTAADQLEAAGRLREAAVACRDWSAALRSAGRTNEAMDVAERASDLLSRSKHDPLWRRSNGR